MKLILKRYKKKNSLIAIVILLLGICYFCYIFTIKLSNKVYNIAIFNIEKKIDQNVLKYYNFDSVINYNVDDLISIEYSKDGNTILNIKYNVAITNEFIDHNLEQLESIILLNKSGNWFNDNNYLIINVPVGMIFNNLYFDSMGPKIPFKIQYLESYYANLNTKIKNYGINNSLVELYLVLTIKYKIVGNNTKVITKSYDYLLAANLVAGKVPSIYNEGITRESNIVEIK